MSERQFSCVLTHELYQTWYMFSPTWHKTFCTVCWLVFNGMGSEDDDCQALVMDDGNVYQPNPTNLDNKPLKITRCWYILLHFLCLHWDWISNLQTKPVHELFEVASKSLNYLSHLVNSIIPFLEKSLCNLIHFMHCLQQISCASGCNIHPAPIVSFLHSVL